MKVRISISVPSLKCQWVMSLCQHSLGSDASKRMNEARGRFLGSGVMNPRRLSVR